MWRNMGDSILQNKLIVRWMCLESWEKGGPGEKKLKIAWKPGIWARNIVHHTPLSDHSIKKRKQVNQTKDIHSPNNVCFVHSSRLQRIFAPLRMQIETKMFVEAFQCFHVQTSGYIILCYSSYLSLITWGGTPQGVTWDWLTIYWSEKCLQNTILHQPHRP